MAQSQPTTSVETIFPWRSVLTCAQTSRSWISSSGRAVSSFRRADAMGFDDCVGAGMDAGRMPFPYPPFTWPSLPQRIHLHNVMHAGDICSIWITEGYSRSRTRREEHRDGWGRMQAHDEGLAGGGRAETPQGPPPARAWIPCHDTGRRPASGPPRSPEAGLSTDRSASTSTGPGALGRDASVGVCARLRGRAPVS